MLLHQETVGMMSKYQVVYQKMHIVLKRLCSKVEKKTRTDLLRRAFGKFKK